MVPTNSVASKFWELFCLLLTHYLLWLFLSLVRILGTFLPLTSLQYFRTSFIPKRVNLMKHFMIVIYDSRDIWLENCPYYNSRVVIYARKMFIRLPQCCFSQVSLSRFKQTEMQTCTNQSCWIEHCRLVKLLANLHLY